MVDIPPMELYKLLLDLVRTSVQLKTNSQMTGSPYEYGMLYLLQWYQYQRRDGNFALSNEEAQDSLTDKLHTLAESGVIKILLPKNAARDSDGIDLIRVLTPTQILENIQESHDVA